MTRVGVVGCGYWGSKHVRVLRELLGGDGVVAVDSSEERLGALARSFPGLVCRTDLVSALNDVDALVIATPPRTHAPLARFAMSEGKHVLIEKPFATSTADAESLVAMAEEAGVVLMAGHTFEYNAAVDVLREQVLTGELGQVHYIDAARLNLGLYQPDVNVIWDLAPHDISIMNYVLGTTPTRVAAWGSRHAHRDLEDVAYVRFEYDEPEVTAQLHVSWLYPNKVRKVTVVGNERMAVYDDLADDERIRVYDKGVIKPDPEALHAPPMSYRYGGIVSPYIAFTEPLSNEDRHFLDCIRTGHTPRTDGYAGLAVVRLLEAANQALREQRVISLQPQSIPQSTALRV